MRIGAHVRDDDPIGDARERGAAVVQFFLADPQSWKAPKTHRQNEELLCCNLTIFVHSPYIINVSSTNNRIRIPSRKLVQQHATAAKTVGAQGLILHGGHVTKGEEADAGFENWRKL